MKTETHVLDNGYRTIHTYDDAGLHVRTTDYDSGGNPTFDIRYAHNEAGDVTGWQVFNGAGELIRRFEVDYDSRGLESEHREYGGDGRLITRELYFYDAEGRKIGGSFMTRAATCSMSRQHNNGMHPTRDTAAFIYLQSLGRAGDAWR